MFFRHIYLHRILESHLARVFFKCDVEGVQNILG